MLSNVSSSVFTNSNSIYLTPVISAEWNQNLFNSPYLTVAGDASSTGQILGSPTPTPTNVGGSLANPYFITKSFSISSGTGNISYPITITSGGTAYKIVTYVMTDNNLPIMINAYAKGSSTQFGSSTVEANSYGWTKIITYVGSSGSSDTISSLTYTINANTLTTDVSTATIYYTVPEIYQTTYFDYQNNTLWSTDSVFTYFRPGESYVQTGDSNFSFPTGYRQISAGTLSKLINGYNTTTYAPISSIVQNPSLSIISNPVPFFKNALACDINPYKYFVSDTSSKSISALYAKNIISNKLVLKFNTLMTNPTVSISLDGTSIGSFTPDSNGLIILYCNGSTWSTNKWSTVPTFGTAGSLTVTPAQFKKITVTQTSYTLNSQFTSFSNTTFTNVDAPRMHLVEISPRLEIDLTQFVQTVDINKSLDNKSNNIPISSINSNDANIILSGIPIFNNNTLISIFSNLSNQNASILANMLRKNIKFYINFNLQSYADSSGNQTTGLNTYIPGGIFYSDTWNEADIETISIQCFDVTRYLQTMPVPDYVANLKTVYEVITNILDLAGFTDYDPDSLYQVTSDKANIIDLFYYYCNSKDTTLIDALNQILLPYQIGAYVDEYGVMKFLSLSKILSTKTSTISLSDSNVVQNGYNLDNKAKPGKISIRYTTPKLKQSLGSENVVDPDLINSSSFAFATANDVVWQQQTVDSVGYNYLASNFLEKDNKYNINKNAAMDFFHTFNLNNNGYAAIENEIVSMVYKQYTISNGVNTVTVSVKNDIELAAEINRFTKKYQSQLTVSTLDSNGLPTSGVAYDITTSFNGYVSNVQRGLFGTVPTDHKIISAAISEKALSEKVLNNTSYGLSSGTNTSVMNIQSSDANLPSVKVISTQASSGNKTLIYPTGQTDPGYKTYSVKFTMPAQDRCSAGLFFNMASTSSSTGAYFVELIRFNRTTASGSLYNPPNYQYLLALYNSGATAPFAWADVTGECRSIVANFEKILVNANTTPTSYTYSQDAYFNLKITHYTSNGEDGENSGEVLLAFINNIKITGWQTPISSSSALSTGWNPISKNTFTGLAKNPTLTQSINTGTVFGFFSSISPIAISSITYPASTSTNPAQLREIYACEKSLIERSVNYWYQDREFLNGMIQGRNLFSKYKNYIMQTNPAVSGINVYDVQYTNPAATNIDILPIEYLLLYFPNDSASPITAQTYWASLNVDEYSLAYSTPINTGFRAKFAIANNSSHIVHLNRQSDQFQNSTVYLNLYTSSQIAPSDPEILEYVVDPSNILEVAQVDTEWIQSKEAATKVLNNIQKGIDGFSVDLSLTIFGNPLLQVGDIVTLTYPLTGINQQKYVVHSVSQNFSEGLETKLVMNMIDKGISY